MSNRAADRSSSVLTRDALQKLKCKAMRSGVWFKALTRLDRALVDLTIKVADIVRSSSLAKSLLVVAGKLDGLLENRFKNTLRAVGFPLAEKISALAEKWGNISAGKWREDLAFVRFLAVMHINR